MRLSCLGLVLVSLGVGACGVYDEPRSGDEPQGGNAPDCVDDAKENDDTLEQGLAAGPIGHVFNRGPLSLPGRVACPGDEDWIHARADCCSASGARVSWDAAQGPLEVELLDAAGAPISLDAPDDIVQRQPGEVYLLRARYGGSFLVRVRTPAAVAVPYSVEVFAPFYLP
ncbi:hypothetical protein D187_007240 [Cystobacter fuscus DSM 2262]|uniref:Lipoprotein n=1 Tax=Cystobacter fuscus (strain ATCC 25194 / DSM 2262 / NBRC 100088 / M29) TaxID=1242864 RepID=S9NX59_CYSF2|nr:hypothetical protein [Cystobacter fuscus]EPX56805.1 hypothetical protein D187_007240 [Cystobacter fuscus DSM 2262]